MGNGLASVSSTSIPTPCDDFKPFLEELGFEFGECIGENKQMINVKFPEGYGLYEEFDRGDMWNGYICNTGGQCIAYINWMSKGAYDNTASISKLNKVLDLSNHTFNNRGFFVAKRTNDHEYVDMLNDYYEAQYRGEYQSALDEMYDNIKNFEGKHSDIALREFEKLDEQSRTDGSYERGAAMAMSVEFAKPFFY